MQQLKGGVMTVDPRLQLTPGEYLIHPDGSASKVVDRRNMTVDEILAARALAVGE